MNHETMCVLTTTNEDATLEVAVSFTDCNTVDPYESRVSCSDRVPTHTSLRQAENALVSTIAYPC